MIVVSPRSIARWRTGVDTGGCRVTRPDAAIGEGGADDTVEGAVDGNVDDDVDDVDDDANTFSGMFGHLVSVRRQAVQKDNR